MVRKRQLDRHNGMLENQFEFIVLIGGDKKEFLFPIGRLLVAAREGHNRVVVILIGNGKDLQEKNGIRREGGK
jgi:hypothetical protein